MENTHNYLCYHYCSVDTFTKIIGNSTIRLSNPYKMNDTQEYKWLLNLLPEIIEEYTSKIEDVEEKQKYIDFYVNTCKEIFEDYYQEEEPPYIACFSKKGDILSQWRSYADNSRGVSIGFSLEVLAHHQSLEFINVNYDIQEQKNLLLDALKKTGLENPESLDFHRMKHMFTAATNVLDNILDKSIYSKNPAFKEEKEVRLIYTPNTYALPNSQLMISDIQFRNDNEKLISYYELDFSKIKTNVIKEIYIGSNSKLNDNDLKLFLKKHGYSLKELEIFPSSSTYR
ncbi:DUF2971 domain-containing protein [Paenibacillus polymyxa]|uniref:DUF2971 domain-containing protein n=1 Tax=Paenibacillus polymyxa TaxID=1406 RepID=UPI0020254D31|nr:DUF2971 domain-containing protein [Paenibacillus polymyxa]MDU8672532.1 DUF2971 domain-containing protein [Paenibacillus polymyxa]MDU8697439.1 DUF2971 domain-containing protein [Paenibacillus polymyxa]URJ56604.1 DUF2971 domain-containing protein [Paenibacillus polymyxa]URJ71112.1 DUF2971 domain-containing protein [Paenibacillus polymyxa]WDZ61504.1 DUF2971 domain-containing protein [Paenibacillus polymyxa]